MRSVAARSRFPPSLAQQKKVASNVVFTSALPLERLLYKYGDDGNTKGNDDERTRQFSAHQANREGETMKTINKSYLMWVGADNYPTIEDWVEEAQKQGVSKRLPGIAAATSMLEEGTAIFVAHDNGEYRDCPECLGTIECGECRKSNRELERLSEQLANLKAERAGAKEAKDVRRLSRRIDTILDKVSDATDRIEGGCELCKGEGRYEAGTGGTAQVNGKAWDYRTYNYHLHHGGLVDPVARKKAVTKKDMCEHCGGTGRLPEGKVFGMFLPESIEYIADGKEDAEKLKAMEEKFSIVSKEMLVEEEKRKCGKRVAGGLYASTSLDASEADVRAAVKELVESGALEATGAAIHGGFAEFLTPVPIPDKRFRGIKRWALDPGAEAEAEMILEATE